MPTALVSPLQWANFEATQNKFHMEVGQGILTWIKTSIKAIPKMGNDEDVKHTTNVELNCLFDYNVKRVWPLTKYTDTGEEDKQSEVAILNKDYLRSLNLLDANDNFAYDAGSDKFIYKGIMYYAAGDTYVSQLPGNTDLFYYLVLKRTDNASA